MMGMHRRAAAIGLLLPLIGWSSPAETTAHAAGDPSPAAGGVTGVAVVPATGRAEIVISVDASVDVNDFRLGSPERIVIDFSGARLEMPARGYDRVSRGGVTNVRYAQFQPGVVRVVIELEGPYVHEVTRYDDEVRVAVIGSGSTFEAWSVAGATSRPARESGNIASRTESAEVRSSTLSLTPPALQSQQPRITVVYEDADIRDVIAAFATFAGRTIVVGREVTGAVTAEVRNQPWDVALRAILQSQGLAAAEDPVTGIIAVDSYRNIAARQSVEPLVTQIVPINYSRAAAMAPLVRELLARDCTLGVAPGGEGQSIGGGPAGSPSTAGGTGTRGCYVRGAVVPDSLTNALLISETPGNMPALLDFIRNMDLRTPQVAIKAKIIFVNRSDIEELGLAYDIGTRDQFFSRLAPRIDPSTMTGVDTDGDGVPDAFGGGTPFTGDRILLGGNTLSAIANANQRVSNPALQLVFSTALGRFSLTSFLDALQEVRLADLQAEPSVVTLNNRRAEILVGQEIPIRVLDASTAQAGAAGGAVPRATVQLKEVGIILSVLPQVTNNRQVLLTVHAENSDAQLASSDVGFIFGKQRADNQLLVNDGETAVIGGLTVTQVTQSKAGIPLLVDLPFLGRLFGQTRTSEEKRDLLILITPHIVDEGERMDLAARGR